MSVEAAVTVPHVDWESPVENLDDEGNFMATRVVRCAYAERIQLMKQFKGGWIDDEENHTSLRVLPARYPARESVFVSSVSAVGWPALKGKDTTPYEFPHFDYALVTVNYKNNTTRGTSWGGDDSLIVSHRFEGSVEVLTKIVEDNTLFYTDAHDAVPVDATPNVLIPMLRWNISIREVRFLDDTIVLLMGGVNADEIDQKFLPVGVRGQWAFLPETVRYDAPDMEETLDDNGHIRYNITLQLSVLVPQPAYPSGWSSWNHAFRAGRNQPEAMYNHPTDRTNTYRYRPYRTVDMNDMLDYYL